MKENSICGDNRFEIIEKAKEMLLNATNIEDSKEEMKVLTNILFRMWQVGLINEEKLEINKLQKENSIAEDIKIIEEKMNKELDFLIENANKTEQLTAISIIAMKEPIILLFLSILSDYKRVLKENEELKNDYENLSNSVVVKNHCIKNSIPVQKVKDRIEEYKNMLKTCNKAKDIDRIKAINERILELQELLEGRK